MASEELDGSSQALLKTVEKSSSSSEKHCSMCHVSVKQHAGKHGPANCSLLASALRDLVSEVANLRQLLEKERAKALDRESRLCNKITLLSANLCAARDAVDVLSSDVASLKAWSLRAGGSNSGKVSCKRKSLGSRKVQQPSVAPPRSVFYHR